MPAESATAEELVERLWAAPEAPSSRLPRVLFVTGHPDDEAIGAGALLRRLGPRASLVCLTDGAPRDLRDAHDAGFANREEYARERRREFESVRGFSGMDQSNCHRLEFVDQEATLHLVAITQMLATIFAESRPDLLITHPYEGGHPDHDAAAFATFSAAHLVAGSGAAIPIAEFTSYNAGPVGEGWSTDFLPHPGIDPKRVMLSNEDRTFKRRLMECYSSQRWILHAFPCEYESLRVAPRYDFSSPPHPGRLFYERFDWEVDGSGWRDLATKAEEGLGRL